MMVWNLFFEEHVARSHSCMCERGCSRVLCCVCKQNKKVQDSTSLLTSSLSAHAFLWSLCTNYSAMWVRLELTPARNEQLGGVRLARQLLLVVAAIIFRESRGTVDHVC